MDNKIIKVDENLNCIIPECLKKIPQYNHNVQTYTIDCPRYTQNGEDMIEMIPFVSVEKEGVSEPITEACTMPRENQEDKTRMFFEWTITRDATDTKGKLAFVICIKKTVDESIENAWHTYRNDEIEVKKGIKCLDILMHNFPSIIDGVLARIGHLEITAFSGKASDVNYEDKEKMLHTNNVQDAIEKLSGEIHKTVIDDVLSENDNASLVYGEDYQIGDLLKFTTPTEGDRDYCIECYTADSYEEKVFEDGLIEITIEDDRIQQIIVGAHTTVKRPKNTILWEIEQLKVNGSGENPNAVKYVEQELTEEQKKVARANINAADALEVKKNSEELNNESITKILSENAAAVITLGNHYEIGDVLRFTTPTTGNRDYCIEIYKTNDYEELEFSGEDIVIEIVDDSIVQIIVGAYTTVHRTRTTVLGEVRQLKETIDDLKQNGTGTGTVASSVEPHEDDIPKVFFDGTAPTSKAQDELPLTMEYHSKTKTIKSYVTLKVQGDSSAGHPKKNFNIKMFSDEARTEKLKCTFRNWSKTHKYCLKANWIDHTHARNVVNGRLWGQVVKSRADYDNYPTEYKESANCGAVDGFPIKVYINGVYQGIYTWNIRKDGSMFNMDDETGIHSALIADGVNAVTAWRELPTIGNWDWTDELNDTVPDGVKTSFQSAYSFVMNSTDEEFVANIEQYFYLSSLIDYYLFVYRILMYGGLAKSQTMLTYNANKYLANIYDMDTTWALYWNGASFINVETACPDGYEHTAGHNLLYERLVALFPDRIKERDAELRSTVLSDANIINEFERFMDVIGNDLYAEDFAETTASGSFTEIPSKDTNNLQKLRDVIVKRMAYCDEQIPLIGSTVEKIPATGITLSSTTLSFTDSASQTLTATLEPSDTTDRVVWSSNNTDVATVTNGVVKPISNGSATITATAGSVSATCEVTVNVAELVVLTGLTATYTGGEVTEGTALTDLTGITVTATYSDGSTKEVIDYTLSGTIAIGENTITVNYEDVSTTFIVTGTEIDYGEALYPLVNGTFTPTSHPEVTVEVTNGNHVKVTSIKDTKMDHRFINLNNLNMIDSNFGTNGINNQEEVFALSAGDKVKLSISNFVNPENIAYSVGWRIANTSTPITELKQDHVNTDFTKEVTLANGYSVGCIFLYGSIPANSTFEFDVSLIVNNQRYI